jgi:hypothetical protein
MGLLQQNGNVYNSLNDVAIALAEMGVSLSQKLLGQFKKPNGGTYSLKTIDTAMGMAKPHQKPQKSTKTPIKP